MPVTVPSPRGSNSWFPNLAVDSNGIVHIVWCETFTTTNGELESIYYSAWNGDAWSQYVDIVSPALNIRRNSLVIDQHDVLHMTYIDSPEGNPYRLGYSSVEATDAFSAANWAPVRFLNDRGVSYFSEISSFGDTLHVVYEDTGNASRDCIQCADMFYRRSMDGGFSWEAPIRLKITETGSSRPHISVDQNGDIFVTWDEGWDRLTGVGVPQYGVFMYSQDLGVTWSQPMEIAYPDNSNSQMVVESNGQGGIMLVWRTISPNYPGVYYIWSNDYGQTWTQPATLASFVSREVINYFDSYDMATDSAGHIHLLATGHLVASEGQREGPAGLYHFEWDGQRWYPPTQVYHGGLIPEFPRLVIERGNQLHTTWFVRYAAFDPRNPSEIMYARGVSGAPMLDPVATMTPTAAVEDEPGNVFIQPTTTPVPVTTPTLEPMGFVTTESLYTEFDEYAVLLLSLLPVSIILVVAIIIIRRKQRY